MRILMFMLSCIAIWSAAQPHSSYGETQAEMTSDACRQMEEAEAGMKSLYRQINNEHRGERRFIASFRKAQKAWKVFRDAQLRAVFPESPDCYGSAYSMCRCVVLTDLTRDRIRYLEKWVSEENEGDLCAGSMKR